MPIASSVKARISFVVSGEPIRLACAGKASFAQRGEASIVGKKTKQALNLSNNHLWGEIPTGSQLQTLVDPSIYGNNLGLCGFPLGVACSDGNKFEMTEDHKEVTWLCYSVILGFVFGFWLWFGALVFLVSWRFSVFQFADCLGTKVVRKMLV